MKTETSFFQYNIPADNHYCNQPDDFIDVVAKRYDDGFWHFQPVILTHHDLRCVKNWDKALREIEAIVKAKFEPEITPMTIEEVNTWIASEKQDEFTKDMQQATHAD